MKYTENTNREAFVKKLESQNILTIIKQIQQFPWKDYVYEGPCTLMTTDEDEEERFETKQIRATASSSSPYFILGGAAYFVYKTHYRDLLKYMDPTGDIDIHIDLPKIDSIEGDSRLSALSEYFKSTSKTKTDIEGNYELNELTLHYLHWILDLLVKSVNIDMNDLEVYDYDIGDNVIHHQHKEGKVHYAIFQEQHMIKVQIECKVRGMWKPDHLIEMIIVSSDNFKEGLDNRDRFQKLYYDFNGYMIQTFDHMLDDNISAMIERFELIHHPSTQHKLYNHVARIRYLNYIFPFLCKDVSSISKNSYSVKRLLYFVWDNRFQMYHYNYESHLSNKEFMISMIGNFYKALKKNPGDKSFIVMESVNGKKRYVSKMTKDLLTMYKPLFDSNSSFTLKKKSSRVRSFTKKRKKLINMKTKPHSI